MMKTTIRLLSAVILFGVLTQLTGCNKGNATDTKTISAQAMADALHTVMEADRTIYTQKVVNRLANKEKVIGASEYWEDESALPLPAQMFRLGAEHAADKDANFSYALLSMWPVNKQNRARTEVEKKGLKFVQDNPDKNYYETEVLGDKTYFTAVYADKAISPACTKCHNDHKDSPRSDFQLGEVMGGVIIRIALQ